MASSKRTVYGPAALPYFNYFFSEVVSLAAVVVSAAAEVEVLEALPEQAVKSPVVSIKDAAKVVLT